MYHYDFGSGKLFELELEEVVGVGEHQDCYIKNVYRYKVLNDQSIQKLILDNPASPTKEEALAKASNMYMQFIKKYQNDLKVAQESLDFWNKDCDDFRKNYYH